MNDDDEDDRAPRPVAQKGGNRNRSLALGALAPLALCCLCGTGLVLARGSLARYLARASLAGQGISCGDGFDVALDASFAHAEISPCTCTIDQGAVESFEIVNTMTLDLEGQRVTHVHAGIVRVAMRGEGPAVDAGSLGPVASMLGVPARIGGLVGAASQLASMHPPPIDITTLDVTQGGRVVVTVDALSLDGASPLAIVADEVSLPALTGPLGAHATVTIDALSGTASESDVRLAGDLALTGSAPIVGSVTRSGRVTVTGAALDSDAPDYRVELSSE